MSGRMLLISLLALLAVEGEIGMAMQPKPAPPVTLTLSARVTPGALEVRLVVQNTGGRPIQLDMSNRQPPADLSIFDETGSDRYQCNYATLSKDGKSASRPPARQSAQLALNAGESKTYSWTVSKLCDVPERSAPIPAGKYRLQARLGSLVRVEGRTQPVVYTSNFVELAVPGQ